MTGSIIVLTEQALTPRDVAHLVGLHDPAPARYRILVPADTQRRLLADVLDHLSLLELRQALDAVRGHDETGRRASASQALKQSLTELRAAGVSCEGTLVEDAPVAGVEDALAEEGADEVIVITRPHAVEDTFHTDWASRARDRLGVPVLHIYAGSSWLG